MGSAEGREPKHRRRVEVDRKKHGKTLGKKHKPATHKIDLLKINQTQRTKRM